MVGSIADSALGQNKVFSFAPAHSGQETRSWAAQKAMVDVGQGRLGILTISEHPGNISVTWDRDRVRGAIVGGGVGSWAPAFCRTWGRESRRLNRHSPVSVAGLVAGGDEKTNVPLTTGPPTAGPRD